MAGGAVAVRCKAVVAAALLSSLALSGCGAAGTAAGNGATGEDAPRRIVSLNPCIDAIVREVADMDQIAAISHYSKDPRSTSVPLEWARRFPVVGDEAEDVVAMRPDIVIAGPHVAPQTVVALERLGIEVRRFGVPATVEESKTQITELGALTGHPERGRAVNARIDAALAAARPQQRRNRADPSALIWQDGGLVPGRGTLADELLVRTGFRSASAELGLAQWDMLPLEALLWAAPDIVMTGQAGMETGMEGASERLARHPALRRADARIMAADFPSSLLHCGGPVIIRAVAHLSDIRARWEERRGS